VLEEQRRIQEEEQAEAARQKAEEEEERRRTEEVESEERRKAEQARKDEEERAAQQAKREEEEAVAERARLAQRQEEERLAAEEQEKEQGSTPQISEAQSVGAGTPSRQQEARVSNTTLSPTDLEVSGSSPPPYSSPRKPALEREVTPTLQDDNDDDHIQSSPLVASPTREVHAAVAKASMSPHGDKLVAGRSPVSVRCFEDEAAEGQNLVHDIVMQDVVTEEKAQPVAEPVAVVTETSETTDMALDEPVCEPAVAVDAQEDSIDAQAEAEKLVTKSMPASPVRDAARAQVAEQTDAVYKTMRAVVDNLRNHPGNTAFRDPMPLDYASFAESNPDGRGSIDLYIILSRITKREYGTSDLSPSPLEAFTSDLKRMWSLARSFYGPKSPQGQCAALLERFAEVVIAEWKLRPAHAIKSTPTHDAAGRGVANLSGGKSSKNGRSGGAADDKEAARRKAAALMASWNSSIGAAAIGASPTSRGEKRGLNGGDEDVFNSRLAGGRALPFQRRPTKQQRTNSSSGEKAVDMMAFHRAIMGEKAPLPGNVAAIAPAAVPAEVAVPASDSHQVVSEEEAEKENTSPIPYPTAPASKEMVVEEQAKDDEQEVTVTNDKLAVADEVVERSVSDNSTSPSSLPSSIIDSFSSSTEASTSAATADLIAELSSTAPATDITSAPVNKVSVASSRPQRRRNPTRSSGIIESPRPLVASKSTAPESGFKRTRRETRVEEEVKEVQEVPAHSAAADGPSEVGVAVLEEEQESSAMEVEVVAPTVAEASTVLEPQEISTSTIEIQQGPEGPRAAPVAVESDSSSLAMAEVEAAVAAATAAAASARETRRPRRTLSGFAASMAGAGAALISSATAAFAG
jgi:hypothetical protein